MIVRFDLSYLGPRWSTCHSNFCPHRLISQLAFLELWYAHGVQRSLKSRLLILVGLPLPVESSQLGSFPFFTFTGTGRESDNCKHASTKRTLDEVENCEPWTQQAAEHTKKMLIRRFESSLNSHPLIMPGYEGKLRGQI
ncbi:hypothetical protein M758_4G133900 [Ceratodon purpureus]|uniref:Uncharacterized protein n=1 Tax=Ceratodon purpureus TaxID=3225 RepID=A0A8T0IAE1_CERPU|nr:hypothetical protein KC19_4G132600 [Ceratodon purpureus]KAG0619361.1 hypothetical protein M758_4G133900 [Ceratodon purpureus]